MTRMHGCPDAVPKHRSVLLLLFILAGALAIRLVRLGAWSFWGDEVDSLYAGLNHIYFHPPVFLVLARYWAIWAHTDFSLRLLSAVIGTGAVAAAWLLARRVCRSEAVALWSAVFVAVNPSQVHFSREFRMYSLLALVTALSWVAFLSWMEQGGRLRGVGAVTMAAIALYTHHYGVVFLVAQGMAALCFRPWKPAVKKLSIYALALFIIYLPYIRMVLYFSRRMVKSSYWAYPVSWRTPWYLMRFHVSHFEPPLAVTGVMILISLILLAVGVHSCRTRDFRMLLVFGFAAPICLSVTASAILPTSALVARYLVFTSIPFCIALACGASALAFRRFYIVVPLMLLIMQAGSITLQYRNVFLAPEPREVRERGDFRGAASVIQKEYRSGDCIGTTCVSGSEPNWYYLTYRHGIPHGWLLDIDNRYFEHMGLKYGLMEFIQHHYPYAVPVNIDRVIETNGCHRLWLYESQWASGAPPGDFYYDHRMLCRRWLMERYPLVQTWTFKDVDVRLFDLERPLLPESETEGAD
ncbi:glycosyltransferase family 39 protein [bacterium]|nr:glycosyltransferase family 39 protein [candidate division CSSED10-310 bacterium]